MPLLLVVICSKMNLPPRRRSVSGNDQEETILRSTVDFVMVCCRNVSDNFVSPYQFKVWVALDNVYRDVPRSEDCTAEDLCIQLCEEYKIPPLTRTLFALRIRGTDYFLADNSRASSHRHYELRIRYKVPLEKLAVLGERTYEYYFCQVRYDLYHNAIPEIIYPDHRNQILGFAAADMLRALLEEGRSIDDIDKNYKKYIPKVIVKNHGLCAQKSAKQYLLRRQEDLAKPECKINVSIVKKEYLKEIYKMAPNYLAEDYFDVMWHTAKKKKPLILQVSLRVSGPEDGTLIKMYKDDKWEHICSVEDLQTFTRRTAPHELQISLKGNLYCFQFKSAEQLSSFISVCDGYYRLTVKWTFNLSKDDETPSLTKLSAMQCHGPIGGMFSYEKLNLVGSNPGAFILRQCQDVYNVYYLDVCVNKVTKRTYKIKHVKDNNEEFFEFNNKKYSDINKLIKAYQDPDSHIYLKNLVPPLEHDKTQLLLCSRTLQSRQRIGKTELAVVAKSTPRPCVLEPADIMYYTGSMTSSLSGIVCTAKALWKVDQKSEHDVAFKWLYAPEYLEDFSTLGSKWLKVQSDSIVRLYGLVLTSPPAMVFEYLQYGPLDAFLRNNSCNAKAKENYLSLVNLMRVASDLAGALSTLSDAGIVHGHVRCRRLLLFGHSKGCIIAKLAEPSLRDYTEDDTPWLPPEYHKDLMMQKKPIKSVEGDIWAFATTVWEIFSFGKMPPFRLPVDEIPDGCKDIWPLLRACWSEDAQARPRPQNIMRDINSALYKDNNPIELLDEPDFLRPVYEGNEKVPLHKMVPHAHLFQEKGSQNEPRIPKIVTIHSIDSSNPGMTCHVTRAQPLKLLGSGHFGNVYLGEMWCGDNNSERQVQRVAIKELRYDKGTSHKDFENELNIMKTVEHENIVRVLSHWISYDNMVIVMEYMPEGSLQQYLYRSELTPYNFIKYAFDIAKGMRYLASCNVVHRDLAPRNILVENPFKVKISDFGLSRFLEPQQPDYIFGNKHEVPINRYAPEAADGRRFSSQSDVWSYGITLWEIFNRGIKPLPTYEKDRTDELWALYIERGFPKPANCPDVMYDDVMRRCWAIQPEARPTFAELAELTRDLYIKHQRNHIAHQGNK